MLAWSRLYLDLGNVEISNADLEAIQSGHVRVDGALRSLSSTAWSSTVRSVTNE